MADRDNSCPQDSPSPASPACQGLTRAEAFTLKINDIVKSSFINLGLALGNKLGLFETLCKFDGPANAQHIADAAGCKERFACPA